MLTFLHVRILSISLNLILFRCVPKGVDFLKKDGTFRRCRILIYMLLSVFLLSAIILQTGCSWFSSKDLILTVIESNGSEEDRQLQRDCIEEYVQAFENTYEQTVKVQYVKDIPAELSETDVILVGCDGGTNGRPVFLLFGEPDCNRRLFKHGAFSRRYGIRAVLYSFSL